MEPASSRVVQAVICLLFTADFGFIPFLPDRQPVSVDYRKEKLVANVVKFVEDPSRDPAVPLDERGADFQRRVWKALREIPVGSTASYADVANKIGSPKSARAVGRACAVNPLAVVIPCHRVMRSDGAISGYRWGLERKKSLLRRDAAKCLSNTPYGTKQKHKTGGNVVVYFSSGQIDPEEIYDMIDMLPDGYCQTFIQSW